MTDQQKRAAEIFDAAVQRATPAERAAYLDGACGPDRELRAEVEELLKHDAAAGSFLQSGGAERERPTLERLDPFVQRFEEAWRGASPPHIDDFLPGDGSDRLAVLKELVMVDMERRRQAGTPTQAADYLQRYPELAPCLHSTRQQDAPIQAATPTHDSAGERAGMVVAGRYKLLEQIGEGGMGTVWVANRRSQSAARWLSS
jgi:hypothetical protein